MIDFDNLRARASEAILKAGGTQGTITFKSRAVNATAPGTSITVNAKILSRKVEKEGKPAEITALVTTSEQDIEDGTLSLDGRSYHIVSIDQTGAGSGHVVTTVVARER